MIINIIIVVVFMIININIIYVIIVISFYLSIKDNNSFFIT